MRRWHLLWRVQFHFIKNPKITNSKWADWSFVFYYFWFSEKCKHPYVQTLVAIIYLFTPFFRIPLIFAFVIISFSTCLFIYKFFCTQRRSNVGFFGNSHAFTVTPMVTEQPKSFTFMENTNFFAIFRNVQINNVQCMEK